MRNRIEPFAAYGETVKELGGDGCLLVTGERGNPMTIGWGMMGIVWGKPVFSVLVRPSRYSYGLLASTPQFTINVPPAAPRGATTGSLRKALSLCGSQSGRDKDKISACGLTLEPGIVLPIPHIRECPIHYECRVLQTTDLPPDGWEPAILDRYYPGGDFHRVYFAEILGAFKDSG
jgi:flavin reductase (DIM6/NTAB) family NADH-FMN oxidoreductase RutF